MNEDSMRKPLTAEQQHRLAKLAALPDEEIDLSDIPALTEEELREFRRPGPGGPLALPVSTPVDVAVVRWFETHANDRPYHAEINRVLRDHIERAERKARAERKRA
ncbi:MAG: hypothetical protein IT546_04095 [Caulobacteraceae bacterium]|nr:hypothetical protein [Caulobacteraceae bacterium]